MKNHIAGTLQILLGLALFFLANRCCAEEIIGSFTNGSYYTTSVSPNALVQGPDGLLYGTTRGGGYIGLGTVFRIETNGMNFNDLFFFGAESDGSGINQQL